MIILPVTCKQLGISLWILSGVSTLIIYLFYFNTMTFGLSLGFLIAGTLIFSLFTLFDYLDDHEFPIRCKCDE